MGAPAVDSIISALNSPFPSLACGNVDLTQWIPIPHARSATLVAHGRAGHLSRPVVGGFSIAKLGLKYSEPLTFLALSGMRWCWRC